MGWILIGIGVLALLALGALAICAAIGGSAKGREFDARHGVEQ